MDIFKFCANGDLEELKKSFLQEDQQQQQHQLQLQLQEQYKEVDEQGSTALVVALKNKHEECAEFLISMGHNVNFADKETRTCLMYASYLGLLKCVKLLCYFQADVTAKDKHGRSALTYSAIGGHNSVFDFLIDNGAKSQFELADSDGFTPIMHASMNGHDRIVRKLVKLKSGIETDDKNGKTPIHLAIEGGHEKVAKMLVDAGADVTKKDKDGRNTLMKAIVKDQKSIVSDLIKKVDVNEKDNHGISPLMVASVLGDKTSVDMLVKKGANLNDTNADGQSALILAAGANDIAFDPNNICAKDLNDFLTKSEVQLSGLDDLKDIAGIIADKAAKEKNNPDAELNLDWIPDPSSQTNANGNAGPDADGVSDPNLVSSLSIIDPLTGEEVFIPKEKAAPLDDLLLSRENLDHSEIVTSLVEAKADVNIVDKDGRSALFFAAKNEDLEAAKVLVESGADITITDKHNVDLMGLLKTLDDEIINDKIEKIEKMVTKLEEHKTKKEKVKERVIIETFAPPPPPPPPPPPEPELLFTPPAVESKPEVIIESFSTGDIGGHNEESKFEINDRLNEVVEKVVDEKAELKRMLKFKGPTGQNILMIAAFKGQMDTAKKIIGHLDLNAKDFNGFTALSFAAQAGHMDIVDLLLSSGAAVEEKNVKTTLTPLALAVSSGFSEVAKKLISAGANTNFKIKGLTLLMLAINKKDKNLVTILLDGGADIYETDHRGKNALSYAQNVGDQAILAAVTSKDTKAAKSAGDKTPKHRRL
ncbi:MAG: ankyrin repeat domain-containing protein [Oligoflexia bacterium]|nr:ankyrin repeat domain-containing protein [Oligoflexia bacterium]